MSLNMQVWHDILLFLSPKEAYDVRMISKNTYAAYSVVATNKKHRMLFYSHFRKALVAVGLKAKDYPTLHTMLHPYFAQIKELRANIKSFTDKVCTKACLLDVPSQMFSLFNKIQIPSTKQLLSFEEFNSKKTEMSELIKANSYVEFIHPNGDIMKISKALVYEQDEDETTEKISLESFYKEDEDNKTCNIDFDNAEMLKKRQKMLLEKCKIAPKAWDPFKLVKSIGIWIIILCHGGKFSIAIFDKGKLIEHKSDSKYVIRKKEGQRQITKDKTKKIRSVGQQIRRENEKLHEANIEKIMQESQKYVEQSTAIFLHSPGINKYFFLLESKSLYNYREKVYSIPFKTSKAKFTEAMEVMKKLTTVKFELPK